MRGENSHVRPDTELILAQQLQKTGFRMPRDDNLNLRRPTNFPGSVCPMFINTHSRLVSMGRLGTSEHL